MRLAPAGAVPFENTEHILSLFASCAARSPLVSDLAAALCGCGGPASSKEQAVFISCTDEALCDIVDRHYLALKAVVLCLCKHKDRRKGKPFNPPQSVFEEVFATMGLPPDKSLAQGWAMKKDLSRLIANKRRSKGSSDGKMQALKNLISNSSEA